jgi:hypothetical protein
MIHEQVDAGTWLKPGACAKRQSASSRSAEVFALTLCSRPGEALVRRLTLAGFSASILAASPVC